jgi:hypothetical protein
MLQPVMREGGRRRIGLMRVGQTLSLGARRDSPVPMRLPSRLQLSD